MAVTVTENAAREISAIIRNQELDPEKVRLRVGVKGGGCSGFSYILDLTETQRDSDELWEFKFQVPQMASKNGEDTEKGNVAVAEEAEEFTIRVVCDPKSYLYLNGTTIDFREEIMGRGFVFQNPNASSTCGCGSSFSA